MGRFSQLENKLFETWVVYGTCNLAEQLSGEVSRVWLPDRMLVNKTDHLLVCTWVPRTLSPCQLFPAELPVLLTWLQVLGQGSETILYGSSIISQFSPARENIFFFNFSRLWVTSSTGGLTDCSVCLGFHLGTGCSKTSLWSKCFGMAMLCGMSQGTTLICCQPSLPWTRCAIMCYYPCSNSLP